MLGEVLLQFACCKKVFGRRAATKGRRLFYCHETCCRFGRRQFCCNEARCRFGHCRA
jgi:hypothetical protein